MHDRPLSTFVIIVLLISLLGQTSLAQGADETKSTGDSRLFREMQETGKPALIIAGSDGCIYCRQMAAELESNAALKPYVQRMFVVKVDVDSSEWPILRREFNFKASGIPAVFFIRADGELLYGESGKPRDMVEFFEKRFEKAGTILEPKTLAVMKRELSKLEAAQKRSDWTRIAALVAKRSGSGSYASIALEFDRAAAELTEQATKELAAAEELLNEEATQLEGAMALVTAAHAYSAYKPVHEMTDEAMIRAKQDAAMSQTFEDAERLVKAVEHESKRGRTLAVRVYEQVVADRPGTPAATFAAERLEAIK